MLIGYGNSHIAKKRAVEDALAVTGWLPIT